MDIKFNSSENFTGEALTDRLSIFDDVFTANGGSSYTSPLANTLKGIRILGPGVQMTPIADNVIGLFFVTRPVLNLEDDNVVKSPRFAPFYKAQTDSLPAYVRGLLDYRSANLYPHPDLDNKLAWIAPLTNLCKASNGFPDLDLEVRKSNPGIRNEVHQAPVGILDENGPLTINTTFYNPKPGIIPYIFQTWESYIPEVRLGDNEMEPSLEALAGNYWDFDCRIYHFIMNKNLRNIESMYMTVQSIPVTYPMGAMSAIDNESTVRRGQGQDELTIQFSSVGARFDTFEVVDGFNGATVFFNPNMGDDQRSSYYRQIQPSEFLEKQYSVYPWINLSTMELEWWTAK